MVERWRGEWDWAGSSGCGQGDSGRRALRWRCCLALAGAELAMKDDEMGDGKELRLVRSGKGGVASQERENTDLEASCRESWAGGVRHGIGGKREPLKVLEQRNGLVRLAGAKLTLPLAGQWVSDPLGGQLEEYCNW